MSFADMLFGGKLTSILVCQKCKHISQTYEDFNDISLSIKPEDYFFGRGNGGGKKRDKLKKLAKRLTTFPGSGGGGSHVTRSSNLDSNSTTAMTTEPGYQVTLPSMGMQRPSSVPPSPSRPRAGDRNAHPDGENDDSSLVELPRRKSLDSPKTNGAGTMSRVDVGVNAETPSSSGAEGEIEIEVRRTEAVPEEAELSRLELPEQGDNRGMEDNDKEDEFIMESDSSNVLFHVVAPEERGTELIEPTEKERDRKEDVGWARLGRRISIMTVGLGKSKDKEKTRGKEMDRKRWSMDPSGLAKEKVGWIDGSMQKSVSDSGVIEETTGFDVVLDITSKETLRRSTAATSMSLNEDTSAGFSSNHVAAVSRPTAITPSSSSSGSISSTAFNLFKPLPRVSSLNTSSVAPTVIPTSQLQFSQNHNQHSEAPLSAYHSNTRLPLFPNVQRSRSPKPPKPTAAQSEYLGKILADVVSSSSGLSSSFSLFKPPTLLLSGAHPFSTSASGVTGSIGSGGAGMWLGLHHLSGIEECLRLFTAVEVLDGENMVGCRRCWKIANGMLVAGSTKQEEEEDSDQEQEQECLDGDMKHESQAGVNGLISQDNQHQVVMANERPTLEVLSIANINSPVHIPTSVSTPTVSLYTQLNSSDSLSISSLPTEATAILDGNVDPSLVGFSSKEPVDNNNPLQGPGGMSIPTISTTSPSPVDARTSFARAQHLAAFAKESMVECFNESGDNNRTINGVLSGQGPSIDSLSTSTLSTPYATPLSSVPTSLLTQDSSGSNVSGSQDSLVIPKISRHQRRTIYDSSASPSTTDNESSDDEESETSVVSDASAPAMNSRAANISIPQPKLQGQQQQAQAAVRQSTSTPQTKQKEKKPKPVIMRPAYKRYLISLPPPVLVIHLKRFQQTFKMPLISFSHGLKKLDDYVSFPEYLDLKPFLAPKKEDYGLGKKRKKSLVKGKEKCMYRLYAVVVHIGNMVSFSWAHDSYLLGRHLMYYHFSARWTLYSLHSFAFCAFYEWFRCYSGAF